MSTLSYTDLVHTLHEKFFTVVDSAKPLEVYSKAILRDLITLDEVPKVYHKGQVLVAGLIRSQILLSDIKQNELTPQLLEAYFTSEEEFDAGQLADDFIALPHNFQTEKVAAHIIRKVPIALGDLPESKRTHNVCANAVLGLYDGDFALEEIHDVIDNIPERYLKDPDIAYMITCLDDLAKSTLDDAEIPSSRLDQGFVIEVRAKEYIHEYNRLCLLNFHVLPSDATPEVLEEMHIFMEAIYPDIAALSKRTSDTLKDCQLISNDSIIQPTLF